MHGRGRGSLVVAGAAGLRFQRDVGQKGATFSRWREKVILRSRIG